MATTPNPTLISPTKPSILFTNIQFNISFKSPSKSSSFTVKCNNPINDNNGGGLKNLLSGIVDERVDELLNREENRVLLDGLDKATQRVENAKRELAQIQQQQLENNKMKEYINQLEIRAAEVCFLFM